MSQLIAWNTRGYRHIQTRPGPTVHLWSGACCTSVRWRGQPGWIYIIIRMHSSDIFSEIFAGKWPGKLLRQWHRQDPGVANLPRPGSESYHFSCANVIFEMENYRRERELSQSSVACKLEHGDIVGSMSPAGLLVLSWGTMWPGHLSLYTLDYTLVEVNQAPPQIIG